MEQDPASSARSTPPALEAPRLPLRLMLRFADDAFERRFGEHYLAFYHRYAQAALLLGVLLIVGDFLVDWLARPALAANWLRLTVAVPILLAGLAYTLLPQARRLWQPVLGGFIVAAALCLFDVLARIDAEGGHGLGSWVGILNFIFLQFYCFVVLGVQFRVALMAGLAMLGLFEWSLWNHARELAGDAAYWSYHVVTLFILAAGVGWSREYLLRRDFAAQRALEDARAAAEQLARAKSAFLATMSHEIRTPLNGVLGMNELLMDTGLSQQQRSWAEAVQVSGRHLLALINDVLDVSKIEAGRLTLEAVDFELGQLLEEARLMFAQPAAAKGLALTAHELTPHGPLWLRGDPLRLRQVVANLVGNAIKFTERGGVALRAVWEREGEAVRLRIAVEDSGIGIPEAARALIFEKFAQADGSTTRRYGGTGLGLAICRELALLMGGDIEVESRPGEGSRFTIVVALPAGTPGVLPSMPARAPTRLRGTVLLVEDHPVNRSVAMGMLRKLGLDWRLAENGADAVEQVRRHDFDAVLMDCQMPVMDGFAATAAIRALPDARGAKLPIVALTANAGEEDARQCREAGMDGFVAKPFSLAVLAAALAPWLEARSPEAPAATATVARTGAIDRKAIATLMELDEDGELLREVLEGFLQTADPGLTALEAALASRDARELARTAHALKSSAGNVGALALAERYGELERGARGGGLDGAAALIEAIRAEQRRAAAELVTLLREHA
ncbi:ATP-binding protein [Pelomonas sp. KK5]|uniref:ATP-binding protein n=1 Tax=Pelomonas sp. KK5 TaxID=1855730 RepID=UPI00097C9769|nr:ATP-binding protein [Pelomonas sp. KK5]